MYESRKLKQSWEKVTGRLHITNSLCIVKAHIFALVIGVQYSGGNQPNSSEQETYFT